MTSLLAACRISKRYPGVQALQDVDFELRAGEVHVLFGENGAGKSTLISILAGANTPTAGEIRLHGQPIALTSVQKARQHGISAVFQEFSLVPTLTLADNLTLGSESVRMGLIDRQAGRQKARELLQTLGFEIDVNRTVAGMSRAHQQMAEIAKSLRAEVSVLILDEPTASLTDHEAERLFALIRRLKARGVGIVYISHRMQEIERIADRVTVLRDGRKVGTVEAAGTSAQALIEMMTGRSIDNIYPRIRRQPGEVVLEVRDLDSASGVRKASLTVRAGEVVGVAGLVGCGKSELFRSIYGVEAMTGGEVFFLGRRSNGKSIAAMLEAGFFYLPPDRKHEGLLLDFTSRANITLPLLRRTLRGPFGWVRRALGRRLSEVAAEQVELAARNRDKPVGQLSGGNQQKVLFGRGMARPARLYVFDEPTVGVDVGTRTALYRVIQSLCEGGAAVVVISSDLPEVLHLSHRAYVMRHGEIVAELAGEDLSESRVLHLFFDSQKVAA